MVEIGGTGIKNSFYWLREQPWRILVAGVVVALLLAALMMTTLMRPPVAELAELIRTLAATSILSLLSGYVLYRRGLARFRSLSLTLVLAYGWAAFLTLINVLVMARLMFVNEHDLALSVVLVFFAAIIAASYGIFVSASLTDSLSELAQTAARLAAGDLEARVHVSGQDEVAQAGAAFNMMATSLQKAARERREVEQMRRDLIAWTSHDLRTPLTSVRAMVEALHDGVVTEEATVQRYYRTIHADILALNGLIDDLFELAQLEAGGIAITFGVHSLGDLISDTVEGFQALAEKHGVDVQGEVAGDVDPVIMNAQKIGRVLDNLVGNAIRHSEGGGHVLVRAQRGDSGITVTVEDDGPGFAPEDLPRVFEQFYRGEGARSRKTGGAGLGLAIAQAIVRAHGGEIWAENRAPSGAKIEFLLPDGGGKGELC